MPPPRAQVHTELLDPAGLSSAKCSAMLRDPSHQFRRMWAAAGWGSMDSWQGSQPAACWERERSKPNKLLDPSAFFYEVVGGFHCAGTDWYESREIMRDADGIAPVFAAAGAPAVLGFDDSIATLCEQGLHGQPRTNDPANNCWRANLHLLNIVSGATPYNLCRNLEWLVCAAIRLLPGQGTSGIVFAFAPKNLRPKGSRPLG
eukprot:758587-Prymnesium_polylepis.1